MKLTIEHLAPYLPFGLKVDVGQYSEKNVELTLGLLQGYNIESIKPNLRPLSDLTKEIEHNGETFVPVVRVCAFGVVTKIINDSDVEKLKYFISDWENKKKMPQWCYELFTSWHFDMDNLIEKGLAIDLNTIDNN